MDQGNFRSKGQFKRDGESRTPRLDSCNRYSVLATTINADALNKEETEVRKSEGKPLREVTIKIGLERLDTQEGITVEAWLDSGATGLVMSLEFARKKGFKLKKLERPMQVRNVNGSFNREGPIENTVEVNVYYKGHVERMEIDVIGGQKWGVILGMPWLEHHNPEIDWKTGEVKMTRCPEECGKQWRLVQGKSGWEKQKKEEAREEKEEKRRKSRRKGRWWKLEKWRRSGKYGTKKRKWQNQKQRRGSWYRRSSTDG